MIRRQYIDILTNMPQDIMSEDDHSHSLFDLTSQVSMNTGKIAINFKPIVYICPESEECGICRSEFEPDQKIVQCHQCKHHLHSDCQSNWCYESINIESEPTCPFCRAQWKHNNKIYYPIGQSKSCIVSC
jgi:hypothetical protein